MEVEEDDQGLGSAVIVYLWSLYIATRRLGWPDEEDVSNVFASM